MIQKWSLRPTKNDHESQEWIHRVVQLTHRLIFMSTLLVNEDTRFPPPPVPRISVLDISEICFKLFRSVHVADSGRPCTSALDMSDNSFKLMVGREMLKKLSLSAHWVMLRKEHVSTDAVERLCSVDVLNQIKIKGKSWKSNRLRRMDCNQMYRMNQFNRLN